jgi:hypothetical protein
MQSGADSRYMSYVYDKIKEKFSYLPAEFNFSKQGEFTQVTCCSQKQFCPYVGEVWGCGDWCPLFSCEIDIFAKATVSLCHKKFIIEPIIDER